MEAIRDARNTLYRKKYVPPTTKMVFPCCCPTKQEDYYRRYTIFMIITSLIILIYCVVLAIHFEPTFSVIFYLNFILFLTIFCVIGFIVYKRTGNYGNNWCFAFAIIWGFSNIVITIMTIFFLIWSAILPTITAIDELETMNIVIFASIGLYTIFLLYMSYLNILYFIVIWNKRYKFEEDEILKQLDEEENKTSFEKSVTVANSEV